MTKASQRLTVRDITVQVTRKNIKHLHLSVNPPQGSVRVSAPKRLSDESIRLAVIERWSWIRKQQAQFDQQPRQSQREMVSGESHYFRGKRYRLKVVYEDIPPVVRIARQDWLELQVRPDSDRDKREAVLQGWYRQQLRETIPALIAKYETLLGVEVAEFGIKRMKTRWGTCNIGARRIWLNLELAKKPIECLEYVVVHEMVHLLERYHNDHFKSLMDKFYPQWRSCQDMLNRQPLGHETWTK